MAAARVRPSLCPVACGHAHPAGAGGAPGGGPRTGAAALVDTSCKVDADCVVKDVGSCCGVRPACVNRSARVDAVAVAAACRASGRMSVCGFESVSECGCSGGRCCARRDTVGEWLREPGAAAGGRGDASWTPPAEVRWHCPLDRRRRLAGRSGRGTDREVALAVELSRRNVAAGSGGPSVPWSSGPTTARWQWQSSGAPPGPPPWPRRGDGYMLAQQCAGRAGSTRMPTDAASGPTRWHTSAQPCCQASVPRFWAASTG